MKDPFDWLAKRSMHQEKELVRGGAEQGMRRVQRRVILRGATWLAVVIGFSSATATAGSVDFILRTVMFAMGVTWVMLPLNRSLAYRNAWLDGRGNMAEQIKNHGDPQSWANSIIAHDLVHVLGFGVHVPDSPEGLDEDDNGRS